MKKQEPIKLDKLIKQQNLLMKLKAGIEMIQSIPSENQGTKSSTIGSIAKDLQVDRNQLKRYLFTQFSS